MKYMGEFIKKLGGETMKKAGEVYEKDGVNYLVVDDDLIRKFEPYSNDYIFIKDGIAFTFGASENTIDTSLVTDMSKLINEKKFKQDIGHWNFSNVVRMDNFIYSN